MIPGRFSVVIPTLQRSELLEPIVDSYAAHPLVAEVLVINNARVPLSFTSSKVKVLQQGCNIYVNPAWNLGARMAQAEWLVLANDDLIIDDSALAYVAKLLGRRSIGIVGPSVECFEPIPKASARGHGLTTYPRRFYGTFLCMRTRNFVPIPEDMPIWAGDDWLFWHSPAPPVALKGFRMQTAHGTTSSSEEFRRMESDNWAASVRHIGKLLLDSGTDSEGLYGIRWWHRPYYWKRRVEEKARHLRYRATGHLRARLSKR